MVLGLPIKSTSPRFCTVIERKPNPLPSWKNEFLHSSIIIGWINIFPPEARYFCRGQKSKEYFSRTFLGIFSGHIFSVPRCMHTWKDYSGICRGTCLEDFETSFLMVRNILCLSLSPSFTSFSVIPSYFLVTKTLPAQDHPIHLTSTCVRLRTFPFLFPLAGITGGHCPLIDSFKVWPRRMLLKNSGFGPEETA